MREYFAIYFITLSAFWIFEVSHSIGQKSEKNQQTFVVRYKNGDQTIPVTVVLDDKKQTEYVINMSPRTPDKSVTLYDFKQRTIAYKDLTNRECFLGRLTDETLKHEIDALEEVRSPIESNPKILSLDPHRSALTPTEIRNIAGQKTAVFCRKMNTWLIMPQGRHTIQKREVDEIEERTYSHHGFHTVQYSHYGHEKRRRYQRPRPTSLHLTHKEERSLQEYQGLEPPLVSNSTLRNNSSEEKYPGRKKPFHESPLLTEANLGRNEYPTFENKNAHSEIPEKASNLHYRNSFESPLHSLSENTDKSNNPNVYILKQNGINSSMQESEYFQEPGFQDIIKEHNIISNHFNRDNQVQNPNSIQHRNIEMEDDRTENKPHLSAEKNIPSFNSFDDHTENPDVSINVVDIPKIFTKFENLDHHPGSHQILVQPKEDVHTIFEGFHNLQNPFPLSEVENSNKFSTHEDIFNQKNINAHVDDSRTFNAVIDPLEENFPLEGTYTNPTFSPIQLTEQPKIESDYFTTEKPRHSKQKYDLNGNQTSEILLRNIKHENPQTAQNQTEPLHISSDSSLHKLSTFTTSHSHINKENLSPSYDIRNEYLNVEHDNLTSSSFSHSLSGPTVTVQEGIAPNQLRFQNILRHYKPDEIIIDIEKIPTERPPDSISGFQDKKFLSRHIPTRRPFLNITRNNENVRSDISRILPRNNHFHNISNSRRRITNSRNRIQSGAHSPTRRIPHNFDQFQRHTSSNHLQHVNEPLRNQFPTYFNQPPVLDTLPPGVSLHPRHPQAPYANMVRTNMIQSLPQRNKLRQHKLHRQRHHRRKDHAPSSCCRSNEKSSCCSGHRRGMRPNSSCCSQSRFDENSQFIKQELRRSGTLRPRVGLRKDVLPLQEPPRSDNFSAKKTLNEKRNRCEKEKMCRTLYESTQQVMVCRNINIDGC